MLKKTNLIKYLGFCLLILLNIDITTFCESLDELSQNTETISKEEDSLLNWFIKNKVKILILTSIVGFFTILYFIGSGGGVDLQYVPTVDLIMSSLESDVAPPVYELLLNLIVNVKKNPANLESGIQLLQNMLDTSQKDPYLKTQILNQENFQELIKNLIKELEKK